MEVAGTQTGRFVGRLVSITDLPKGAHYMTTANRAQMAAAIKAVPYNAHTVIEAISDTGKVLVRYVFSNTSSRTPLAFDYHLRRLARNVMKTSADIWR